MNKSQKIWVGAVVVIVIILVGWQWQRAKQANNGTIKIGAVLPLSGDLASIGEEIQRGIILGSEDLKRKNVNAQTIFEDDQSLSTTATVSAANKLINIDKVSLSLVMVMEEARPIMPIFQENKIPLIVLWDSNKEIENAGNYIFSNGFSNEKSGEIMAKYAYEKIGKRKIAVIAHVDPAAQIMTDSFKDEFKKLGGQIVYDEQFQPNTTDYRSAVLKIKQTNPDGVYVVLLPPLSTRFFSQAQQLGLRATMLSCDGITQDVIKEAGAAIEGTYFTNIFSISDDSSQLAAEYKNKYGSVPADISLVSFGYDGIMKAAKAIDGSKREGSSIQRQLDSIFGASRSSAREEKVYKIINNTPVEVQL